MGVYNDMIRAFDGALKYPTKIMRNRSEGYSDLVYKGHVILRFIDCRNFCVLESPLLLTDDSHGHTLIVFDYDRNLVNSVVSKLNCGVQSLSTLVKVLIDRFDNFREDKSLYFMVGTVALKLTIDFSGWICSMYTSKKSTYSYIMVCEKMCRQLCECTGHGLEIKINEKVYLDISSSFN